MTEIEIKKLLVNYAKDNYYEFTIAAEVPFQFGERRADIAILTSNQLIGFEIKSANDKITRLAYQNDSYKGFFDYCVVVCEKYNLKKTRLAVPESFGILVANPEGLIKVRKPKLIKRYNKLSLTSTLSVNKLKKILGPNHPRSKYEMCALVSKTKTAHELRELAIEDFFEKYAPSSRLMQKETNSLINSDDILTITKQPPTNLIRRC